MVKTHLVNTIDENDMCELNAHMNLHNKMSLRGNRGYKVKTPRYRNNGNSTNFGWNEQQGRQGIKVLGI